MDLFWEHYVKSQAIRLFNWFMYTGGLYVPPNLPGLGKLLLRFHRFKLVSTDSQDNIFIGYTLLSMYSEYYESPPSSTP